jgi:hypothetical protein
MGNLKCSPLFLFVLVSRLLKNKKWPLKKL